MAQKKKTAATADLSDVIAETEKVDLNLENTTTGTVHIDDSAIINVKSNVFGELIYIDPVTKEEIRWEKCGEVQQLTMGMLRHMKNGAAKFFSNQLIMITGFGDENASKYEIADIYKALFITQYYKNLIDPSDYEFLCSMSASEIREAVSYLSASAKENLVVALNTYIEKGILDSIRTIKTFEEILGCDLRVPE